jgi:hypothetical protein
MIGKQPNMRVRYSNDLAVSPAEKNANRDSISVIVSDRNPQVEGADHETEATWHFQPPSFNRL